MPRKSPLSNYDLFAEAAGSTNSQKEFIESLGLRAAGGTYALAKKWSQVHGIDLPVYKPDPSLLHLKNTIPSELVFVSNSTYVNRGEIKKRLIRLGWKYQCSNPSCPNPEPIWAGEPLSLQLDHINGVHNDNRLENLRFLCPNCHTQTETFAGRKPRPIKVDRRTLPKTPKIEWPSHKDLTQMVDEMGYRKTGRILGVSDNAVRKNLDRNSLSG